MSDDNKTPLSKEARLDELVNKLAGGNNSAGPEVRAKLDALMQSLAVQASPSHGKKPMGEHKFWDTQPVPKHDEHITDVGPIEPSIPVDQVSKDPAPLPKEFEWCELDLNVEMDAKQLYEFLTLNYVEDDSNQFRFDYPIDFLKWALQPPQWRKDWLVGVRVASNKKLVAFISAIPVQLRTFDRSNRMTEINFLNVHKKLRSKRLTPVMIREITRRSHLHGIFQAVYTAGAVLPKSVSTCQYFHRSLNPKKLVECGFSSIPKGWTLARMIKHYKVPEKTNTPGFREMQPKDVSQVRVLLNRYLERFDIAPQFNTDEEIEHWILPHKSVVWSYVVEDAQTKKITDMISFYSLPSSVINNPKHKHLNAAYLFYSATDVAFSESTQTMENGASTPLERRMNELVSDALIMAKRLGFDVMNALHLLDNGLVLQQQKFGPGDGHLNYYLYNWRCPNVDNNKIGLVMF